MLIPFARLFAVASLAASALVLVAAAAQAQNVRFIASNGDNANDCLRATPCRTLQKGINKTPSGGELQILDSANYGKDATVDKAITISADGISATIGALTIDAPGAVVVLRGLLLTGANVPANSNGVHILNAAKVHILRCEIERFTGDPGGDNNGILIDADNVDVLVANTIIRDNSGAGLFNNSNSIVNVHSSTAANNGASGYVEGGGGQMSIESSVATGNGAPGFGVVGGGTGRISNSLITNNGTGLSNTGSTLLSRRNNMVSGNLTETNGTITTLAGL
jgi:hypothetical protein